jgi:nuclease HARBI1
MEKIGFPGVIGCIDGTHVALIRPVDHEESYFNRKNYHSLNVLIVSLHA